MNTEKMDTGKKVYEEPTVKMLEFDFSDRIAASGCTFDLPVSGCNDWSTVMTPW